MTDISTPGGAVTSTSNDSIFNPADWLVRFEAVGGGHMISDGHVSLGWVISGSPEAAQDEARRLCRELDNDEDKRAAVSALILKRKAGEADHV